MVTKKKNEIKGLLIEKQHLNNSFLSDESYEILKKSRLTCKHFLSIYDALNRSKGKPTDKNQDLLRAMLVFSSSSLDVILKKIVRSNLKNLIGKEELCKNNFSTFVKRNIGKKNGGSFEIDISFLADILSEDSGRDALISKYIEYSISDSLQSTEKIKEISLKLGFNIEKEKNIKIEDYKKIFHVRNEIIHQMDVSRDPSANRKRIQRKREDLVDYTNKIFELIEFFVLKVSTFYKDEIDSDSVNI